jgi:dihydropteroate synthase
MSLHESERKSWHIPCGPTALDLGLRTHIMGILNVTPDSFSDGGRYMDEQQAVTHALAMLADGADIIDIGGESTRPGHVPIDADEELRRVLPAIRAIRAAAPQALISVDSSRAAVADAALAAGANILNDQWGLQRDPAMAEVAAKYQAPTIVMHNQQGTAYSDLMPEIIRFLRQSLRIAAAAGLPPELMIVDPGVGFGKTVVQNLDVIRDLDALRVLGRPILLGTSRKGTIGKVLGGLPAHDRVEGTAATVSIGIDRGADIVRVHDVKQMKRVAVMTDALVRPARGGFRSQ